MLVAKVETPPEGIPAWRVWPGRAGNTVLTVAQTEPTRAGLFEAIAAIRAAAGSDLLDAWVEHGGRSVTLSRMGYTQTSAVLAALGCKEKGQIK